MSRAKDPRVSGTLVVHGPERIGDLRGVLTASQGGPWTSRGPGVWKAQVANVPFNVTVDRLMRAGATEVWLNGEKVWWTNGKLSRCERCGSPINPPEGCDYCCGVPECETCS